MYSNITAFHPKIKKITFNQHVVLPTKLGGTMLPFIHSNSPQALQTIKKENIKSFSTKVGQRHITKMSDSFSSKLNYEMLSSRYGS